MAATGPVPAVRQIGGILRRRRSEDRQVRQGRKVRMGRQRPQPAARAVRGLDPPRTPTEVHPTATADAYLSVERGLDISQLEGLYTQETYFDRETGQVSATVRFPLENNSWWERLIDRPGRFKRKANFKPGSNWSGWWWAPPAATYQQLALADDIWFAEGIFDAQALRQAGLDAVSLMSINNYPEHALAELRRAVADSPARKNPPRLVFAFDVGAAGVSATRKFVKRRARKAGMRPLPRSAPMARGPSSTGTISGCATPSSTASPIVHRSARARSRAISGMARSPSPPRRARRPS